MVSKADVTHCRQGHELTEANTYSQSNGERRCRLCRSAWAAQAAAERDSREEVVLPEEARCGSCKQVKPISCFQHNKKLKHGYRPRCRECDADNNRVINHNISIDRYREMLDLQDGLCAICQREERVVNRRLTIDHDHRCCDQKSKSCGKCVRGLLCNRCNAGLGQFSDDPENLLRAAIYLLVTSGQVIDADSLSEVRKMSMESWSRVLSTRSLEWEISKGGM